MTLISHACLGCGLELRRERPIQDQAIGLAAGRGIVVCPRCTRACVRLRPAEIAPWRGWFRLWKSLAMLGVQIAAALGLPFTVALAWSSIDAHAGALALESHEFLLAWLLGDLDGLAGSGASREGTSVVAIVAVALIASGVASGAWLTAGLSHLPLRGVAWVVWISAVVLIVWFDAAWALVRLGGDGSVRHLLWRLPPMESALIRIAPLGVYALAMLAGVPIGRGLGRAWVRHKRIIRGRVRRARRKQRYSS